mmetsp:Transcript_1492/g.4342  ORF Transcript_1492/g.4342 Transcript_1492/m.4342 type:complete len:249 (+) Transcript_1492:92-838(+)
MKTKDFNRFIKLCPGDPLPPGIQVIVKTDVVNIFAGAFHIDESGRCELTTPMNENDATPLFSVQWARWFPVPEGWAATGQFVNPYMVTTEVMLRFARPKLGVDVHAIKTAGAWRGEPPRRQRHPKSIAWMNASATMSVIRHILYHPNVTAVYEKHKVALDALGDMVDEGEVQLKLSKAMDCIIGSKSSTLRAGSDHRPSGEVQEMMRKSPSDAAFQTGMSAAMATWNDAPAVAKRPRVTFIPVQAGPP